MPPMIIYITNATIIAVTANILYSGIPVGTLDISKKQTKANANNIALPTNTPINVCPISKPTMAKGILNNKAEKKGSFFTKYNLYDRANIKSLIMKKSMNIPCKNLSCQP